MKKILVLGSDGMLGHLLMEYFRDINEYELFGIEEAQFSSINFDFESKIIDIMPDIIINTLRMVVHESENNPKMALYINSFFPKYIERLYYESKIKIIHLSTDCVFSGEKGNYSENDLPDGTSIYSISKFCGEIINQKNLTIRTSYIGPTLKNMNEELFDWFLHQSGEVDGYKNCYWNGITTLELAKQINVIIKNNICGLYHLGSKIKISKFDLLSIIQKQWSKNDVQIQEYFHCKIDRSLIDNRKLLNVQKYNTMFKELFNFMQSNKKLYDHYFTL